MSINHVGYKCFSHKGLAKPRPKKKSPYRTFGNSVEPGEVIVKKMKRRFETMPVAEVLKTAVEINGSKPAEKLAEKKEPYAVPVKVVAGQCRNVDR
jgi:hypothetical protein